MDHSGPGHRVGVNLFFRLLWLRLVSRFRSKCDVLGPVRTPFRVMPTDLDVLRHVNNGVYLSLMDLARVDLMIRSDLLPALTARRWYPVVVGQTIRFRRSLTLFQRFHIETRVLGWDEKAFMVEQRFVQGDRTIAVAFVAARFLRTGGTVTPEEVLGTVGLSHMTSPPLPGWAGRLADAQAELPADREPNAGGLREP